MQSISFNLQFDKLIPPDNVDWVPYGIYKNPSIFVCGNIKVYTYGDYGNVKDLVYVDDYDEQQRISDKYLNILLGHLLTEKKRIHQNVHIELLNNELNSIETKNVENFYAIEPLLDIITLKQKIYINIDMQKEFYDGESYSTYYSGEIFRGYIHFSFPLKSIISPKNEGDFYYGVYGLPSIEYSSEGYKTTIGSDGQEGNKEECSSDDMVGLVTKYYDYILDEIVSKDTLELKTLIFIHTSAIEEKQNKKVLDDDWESDHNWSREDMNEYNGYDADYEGDYD